MKNKIITRLGAVALLVTATLTANVAAQNGPILFNSSIQGVTSQVYAIDPDGSNLIQLTTSTSSSGGAAWHPSYQYISFFRDGSLWGMAAAVEGRSVKPFVIAQAQPVGADFSPDGKKIVYCGSRPTDGGGIAVLIRTIDLAKRKVGAPTMVWNGDSFAPSFAPDGNQIAFSSHNYSPDGGPRIKVLNLATGSVRSFDPVIGFIPAWSANGQTIAFCGHTGETRADGAAVTEIFIMNADFSSATRATYLMDSVAWPTFSPDGQTLLFTSHYNGTAALYELSLASGAVTLFHPEANAAHWTP